MADVWISWLSCVQYSFAHRLAPWPFGLNQGGALSLDDGSHFGRLGVKPIDSLLGLFHEGSQGCAVHGVSENFQLLCGRVFVLSGTELSLSLKSLRKLWHEVWLWHLADINPLFLSAMEPLWLQPDLETHTHRSGLFSNPHCGKSVCVERSWERHAWIGSDPIGANDLTAGVSRKPCAGASSERRSWRCTGHGKCTARAVVVHARSFYPRRTVQGRRANCRDLRPLWHWSCPGERFVHCLGRCCWWLRGSRRTRLLYPMLRTLQGHTRWQEWLGLHWCCVVELGVALNHCCLVQSCLADCSLLQSLLRTLWSPEPCQ